MKQGIILITGGSYGRKYGRFEADGKMRRVFR